VTEAPSTKETYCCTYSQPLVLERVLSVEPAAMFGWVFISWRCDCSPGEDQRGQFIDHPTLMYVLFGGKPPKFPFHSRLRWESDMDAHGADMRLWAWEVDQLISSDEMIQWFGWTPPPF